MTYDEIAAIFLTPPERPVPVPDVTASAAETPTTASAVMNSMAFNRPFEDLPGVSAAMFDDHALPVP